MLSLLHVDNFRKNEKPPLPMPTKYIQLHLGKMIFVLQSHCHGRSTPGFMLASGELIWVLLDIEKYTRMKSALGVVGFITNRAATSAFAPGGKRLELPGFRKPSLPSPQDPRNVLCTNKARREQYHRYSRNLPRMNTTF